MPGRVRFVGSVNSILSRFDRSRG